MDEEKQNHMLQEEMHHITIFCKWMVLAVLVGVLVGGVGAAFYHCLHIATTFRMQHAEIVYFLPLGGIVIVWMYHLCSVRESKGTNMVISSVRSTQQVPFKMAPLIFISTVITHLFGGSAGREGAALQIGGSLGHQFGRLCKLDEKDLRMITMCGMSAAFSALFQTPVTAAFFPMEVISVGIMYYAALVPCALASIVASLLATSLGAAGEHFTIADVPLFTISSAVRIVVLAMLCALLARIFCLTLHYVSDAFRMFFHNPYIRIAIGALILIAAYLLFGNAYLGAGMETIEKSIHGEVIPEAFLLKILFTALTLGCGFKGGEIVPSFFIGATFGALIGALLHISPSFCAAIGLMSVFCGVTNCPIASLFLSFELFGFIGVPFFLLADAIAYMLSGYESLYHEQKIMYSKFSPRFIDKK